jgi:hypothetical protein
MLKECTPVAESDGLDRPGLTKEKAMARIALPDPTQRKYGREVLLSNDEALGDSKARCQALKYELSSNPSVSGASHHQSQGNDKKVKSLVFLVTESFLKKGG